MKPNTKKMNQAIEDAHDWLEGQCRSGGGTRYFQTDRCLVCNLERRYLSDSQNGIEDHYRYSTEDGDISMLDALEFGCAKAVR
jgi:hypothetical protein